MNQFTAGTPGNGYLTVPRPHEYIGADPEPGRRPTCRVCGGERREHPTVEVGRS